MLVVASLSPLFVGDVVAPFGHNYFIYGVYDENTGLLLNENVTITFHFADPLPNYVTTVNGTDTGGVLYFSLGGVNEVKYFDFLFNSDNSSRQYWVDPSEVTDLGTTEIYVFKSETEEFTNYAINFLDYTGILETYPFVQAQKLVNGTYYTVEKEQVDAQNTVNMKLINGYTYRIILGNAETTFVYGDLSMNAITGIQLTLKGADFPKESLLQYPYVTFYSYRTFETPRGTILFMYNDTKLQTISLTETITDDQGNIVYTTTLAANSTVITWPNAVNQTIYYLTVTVEHGLYGDITYKQTFANQAGDNSALFSFSFLGDWAFNTAYIIPALIILLVAACFSVLNAEVGAILSTIAGIVLAWIGWLPIPVGALVSAFAFSILMALVYNKRRSGVY